MIKRKILSQAFEEISHDTKFIRLATITTFIHSVLFLLYIGYVASNFISKGNNQTFNNLLGSSVEYIQNIPIGLLIVVGLILLIGYSILPPIGEGAMIYYLSNPKKQGTLSLGKGMGRFFQMFEFDAATSFFNIVIFLAAVSRFYVSDILFNPFVIMLLSIWFIVILLAAFLLPYSRYFIVLKQEKFFEAMKSSMQTSIEHFALTIRFVIVDALLHARFIINIIIILGIPIGLLSLANRLGINDSTFAQVIFVILVVILFLITAYINGIIEAFFTTYWYKLFRHILSEESAIQQAINSGEINTSDDLRIPGTEKDIPQQVTINQYMMQNNKASTKAPQDITPEHDYISGDDGTTHISPNHQDAIEEHIEHIPGAKKMNAPDGGDFIYLPPSPTRDKKKELPPKSSPPKADDSH